MVGSLLLPEASLSDVLLAKPGVEIEDNLHITVLREFTTEPIAPYLDFGLKEMGFSCSYTHSNYTLFPGDLEQEELWQNDPDFVIFAPDTHLLYGGAAGQSFAPTGEGFDGALDAFIQNCIRVLSFARSKTSAPIFILFPLAPYPFATGIAQHNDQGPLLAHHFAALRTALEDEVASLGHVQVISLSEAFLFVGIQACLDRRRQFASLTPFTPVGYREIALEILTRIRARCGKTKKVLVLDCDETIWGGVSGEGEQNVGLNPECYPDSAHLELQAYAQHLSRSGVLVCLVSKNEPETVWNIFDHHDAMILTRDDIVGERINWLNKSENLKSLADELNLNLDSFVFVDNSPAEIHEVCLSCPTVTTVLATEDGLADLPGLIHRSGWFQKESITETDSARAALYKSEQVRKKHLHEAVDHDDFLRSLQMQGTLKSGGDVDVNRAAQMSQRTNQFNLTTKRYDAADMSEFVESPDHWVATLHIEDRFGVLGDVGLVIAWRTGDSVVVDTLLLSCRAFGRYCETILLQSVLNWAQGLGVKTLKGSYRPSAKNALVTDFWEKYGFHVETDGVGNQVAEVQLEKFSIVSTNVYKSIDLTSWSEK